LIEAGVIPDRESCKAFSTRDNEQVGSVEGIANDDSNVLPQIQE
jgi:hypothetical protein